MAAWLQKLIAAAFLVAQFSAATPGTAHAHGAHGPGPDHQNHDQVECVVCAAGHIFTTFIAPSLTGVAAPRSPCVAYGFEGLGAPEPSAVEAGFDARPRAPPRPWDCLLTR